jgi:uncharacterized membrane protein|tara:strand:+ start:2597 stop:3115 length:519 start_codon:yes stop_codon:yes gene_type:complete
MVEMDSDLIPVISRVVHVATAIVLVGGSVFMRFALMPAATGLGDAEHDGLRERVLGHWRRFVHIGIALLLGSGLYNFLAVTMPAHKGDGRYHMLVGIKMLLAFVLFFLASALVGRSSGLKALRDKARGTLVVMIILAAVIVIISSYLKVRGVPAVATEVETAAMTLFLPWTG